MSGDRPPSTGLPAFELERFFAEHEFKVPDGLMCCSDPDALTLAEVLEIAPPETRAMYEALSLGYTESAGLPQLREAVAEISGGGTRAADVLVVAPEEGIYAAMRSLLRAGDRVVVLAPAYQSLYAVAQGIGCEVAFWNLREDAEGGGWRADTDELRALVAAAPTRLVVVNAPHNPTGFTFTAEQQREVVAVARDAGAWLFSDEMYRLLEGGGDDGRRLPAAHTLGYRRVVSLCGVSKSLGGPGLRIGWLCTADDALMTELRSMKDYLTICSSAPSEVLALALVQRHEEVSARMRARVREGLAAAEALVSRVPWALALPRPRAGSTVFVRLLLPGVSDADFARRLVDERGLLVLPGSLMGSPGYLRLGLGRRAFPALAARLAAYIEEVYPAAEQ